MIDDLVEISEEEFEEEVLNNINSDYLSLLRWTEYHEAYLCDRDKHDKFKYFESEGMVFYKAVF